MTLLGISAAWKNRVDGKLGWECVVRVEAPTLAVAEAVEEVFLEARALPPEETERRERAAWEARVTAAVERANEHSLVTL